MQPSRERKKVPGTFFAGGSHSHGISDDALRSSRRGLWAIKISFVAMVATALVQAVVVAFTGSVALLADTIHNFGDALTALPLAAAFMLATRPPSRRFSYGLSRSEDLAGIVIVLIILASAIVAGYESVDRLINPKVPANLYAVMAAGMIGFLGNEAVAVYRIKVGREIGSAALIADGKHARIDGWTSLAVLLGAVGVKFGFELADPIVGLGITILILRIVWQTARDVGLRALDAIEPETLGRIEEVAASTDEVISVHEVRARWVGHEILVEVNIAVRSDIQVATGHQIAKQVRQKLMGQIEHIGNVIVHVDPADEGGERFH